MATPQLIFTIPNSTSVNHIRYYATEKNGDFNIDVAWFSNSTNERARELNWIERNFAYGFSLLKGTPGKTQIKICALKSRQVFIQLDEEGNIIATTDINGKHSLLKKVFVQVSENKLKIVDHVDIIGVDLETKEEIQERYFR